MFSSKYIKFISHTPVIHCTAMFLQIQQNYALVISVTADCCLLNFLGPEWNRRMHIQMGSRMREQGLSHDKIAANINKLSITGVCLFFVVACKSYGNIYLFRSVLKSIWSSGWIILVVAASRIAILSFKRWIHLMASINSSSQPTNPIRGHRVKNVTHVTSNTHHEIFPLNVLARLAEALISNHLNCGLVLGHHLFSLARQNLSSHIFLLLVQSASAVTSQCEGIASWSPSYASYQVILFQIAFRGILFLPLLFASYSIGHPPKFTTTGKVKFENWMEESDLYFSPLTYRIMTECGFCSITASVSTILVFIQASYFPSLTSHLVLHFAEPIPKSSIFLWDETLMMSYYVFIDSRLFPSRYNTVTCAIWLVSLLCFVITTIRSSQSKRRATYAPLHFTQLANMSFMYHSKGHLCHIYCNTEFSWELR